MSAHKQHGTHVPEPFVWFFFETLAKAGLLMDRGDLEQHRGDGFWKLILHRDIKLPNSRAARLSGIHDSFTDLSSQYS